MRGKPVIIDELQLSDGITPADAGKTAKIKILCCSHRDHPRGCGENSSLIQLFEPQLGSPPRMRGKLIPAIYRTVQPGITPADAGKTFVFSSWRQQQQDHPRGCGENFDAFIITPKQIGSPPRMRGKLHDNGIRTFASWITPADAGKTSKSTISST